MTESLTKADGTATPIGTLANYSVSHSAIPVDPRNTAGQIPTFSAVVTDPQVDTKGLVGMDATLEDWTGATHTGRIVASASNVGTGATSMDANTIFEKLNTTQTTLPIVYPEGQSYDTPMEALKHWFLTCGVPEYRLDGNLLHYIDGDGLDKVYIGNTATDSLYGYIADSISKFRFYGPPGNYFKFVPSADPYLTPIEVNPAQPVVIGGSFRSLYTTAEIVIDTQVNSVGGTVSWILRRDNDTWTLRERVGSNPDTVLMTKNYVRQSPEQTYVFVEVSANAATDKVDLKMRHLELVNGGSVYNDATVTGVTSLLRKRPKPYAVRLGYDSVVAEGHLNAGPATTYFMLSGNLVQDKYPVVNYTIRTSLDGSKDAAWNAKNPSKLPGFTDNVWDQTRELCALLELDLSFEKGIISIYPRNEKRETGANKDFVPALPLTKGNLSESFSGRETAKSVEVNYREMVGSENDYANTLLWKATSVYSLEKGERKEELVQTNSSFVFLHSPVAVSGVPVPYTSAFSSYVITGADGYIVDPQWWNDNGGYIRVYNTDKSGEIKIVMQAPTIDTARAPYRVSEGVADRPALYIKGYGMQLSDPIPVKVYTGAEGASQEVGVTYDSKLITKKLMAYNAAHKLAVVYGTAAANTKFNISKTDVAISANGDAVTPLADCIYWGGSYYRIVDEQIGPRGISVGNAAQFNTIRVVNGEFATGRTIADWNALHTGKLIRETNAAPLPRYAG